MDRDSRTIYGLLGPELVAIRDYHEGRRGTLDGELMIQYQIMQDAHVFDDDEAFFSKMQARNESNDSTSSSDANDFVIPEFHDELAEHLKNHQDMHLNVHLESIDLVVPPDPPLPLFGMAHEYQSETIRVPPEPQADAHDGPFGMAPDHFLANHAGSRDTITASNESVVFVDTDSPGQFVTSLRPPTTTAPSHHPSATVSEPVPSALTTSHTHPGPSMLAISAPGSAPSESQPLVVDGVQVTPEESFNARLETATIFDTLISGGLVTDDEQHNLRTFDQALTLLLAGTGARRIPHPRYGRLEMIRSYVGRRSHRNLGLSREVMEGAAQAFRDGVSQGRWT